MQDHWERMGPWMMSPDGGGWFWGMALHAVFAALFIAVVVVVVVLLVRSLTRPDRSVGGARERDALDILQARYARGEIDREDFLQKKKDLS
jgi:putative membrane protein